MYFVFCQNVVIFLKASLLLNLKGNCCLNMGCHVQVPVISEELSRMDWFCQSERMKSSQLCCGLLGFGLFFFPKLVFWSKCRVVSEVRVKVAIFREAEWVWLCCSPFYSILGVLFVGFVSFLLVLLVFFKSVLRMFVLLWY